MAANLKAVCRYSAGLGFLFKNLQEEDLDGFHDDKSNLTRYEIIQGIVQHDAYHLGQIKLLVRIFQ